MSVTKSVSSESFYREKSEIHFSSDNQDSLSVTIRTARLFIRSIEATKAECDRYADLLGRENVMEKFGSGQTYTRDEVKGMILEWVKQWQARDPYGRMAVFTRDTNSFLGHVVLTRGDDPGVCEISYLFNSSYWGKGYASEAVMAVLHDYIPEVVQRRDLLGSNLPEKIVATARIDNPASNRILQKVGMQYIKTELRDKAMRNHYAIQLSKLVKGEGYL